MLAATRGVPTNVNEREETREKERGEEETQERFLGSAVNINYDISRRKDERRNLFRIQRDK